MRLYDDHHWNTLDNYATDYWKIRFVKPNRFLQYADLWDLNSEEVDIKIFHKEEKKKLIDLLYWDYFIAGLSIPEIELVSFNKFHQEIFVDPI